MLPKRLQSDALVRTNIEDRGEVGNFEHVQHLLVQTGEFQISAGPTHHGVAAHQLADAIAIDELHSREIEDKFLSFIRAGDVNLVAKLGVTVRQGKFPRRLDHDDGAEFPCVDLKSHACAVWVNYLVSRRNSNSNVRRRAQLQDLAGLGTGAAIIPRTVSQSFSSGKGFLRSTEPALRNPSGKRS